MIESLAHYKIVRKIGEGGMGEVFLAEDTRLRRQVALKMIPRRVREQAAALQRFQIEAEAAAKLNHPNVATIYSVEDADGEQFITMEYVEGQPLNELIGTARLSLDRFFEWFIPLAEGLAHAHEAAIIHRDIKPANIVVTQRGVPKILDFGLAYITQPEVESGDDVPTRAATKTGAIVGTPSYMSPEQAESKPQDARCDVFSFGVVMYEALSGERPFRGGSTAAILSSLLRDEPPLLSEQKSEIPYNLSRLVSRCLQKDPLRRVQSMLDVRNQLVEIKEERASGVFVGATTSSQSVLSGVSAPRRGWRRWALPAAASALVVLVAVLGWLYLGTPPGQPSAAARQLPIALEGFTAIWTGPEISTDGSLVVYTLTPEGPLWVRSLGELEPRALAGTEGSTTPFWSPDGTRIGYFNVLRNSIEVIPAAGGLTTKLADWPAGLVIDATWGANDRIIANIPVGNDTGLYEIPTTGGEARAVRQPDFAAGEIGLFTPSFLPDGSLMYMVLRDSSSEIVADLPEGRKTLFEISDSRGAFPTYSPSGHLLYQRDWPMSSGLWAVPFSLADLEVTGEPFLLAAGGGWPSLSIDGTLVYRHATRGLEELVWVDRAGRLIDSVGRPHARIVNPAISPDGSMVAIAAEEEGGGENSIANSDVWVYDLQSERDDRLSFDPDWDNEPAWYPDSARLVFNTFRNFAFDFYQMQVDGTGDSQPLLVVSGDIPADEKPSRFSPQISSDGRFLVFASQSAVDGTNFDVFYLALGVEGAEPVRFLQSSAAERGPQLSPSGNFIAFYSNDTGRNEVYVYRFPAADGRWQISTEGGTTPRWNRAGDRLYYVRGDELMEVEIETEPRFRPGVPRRLFTWEGLTLDFAPRFALGPDAERFLLVRSVVAPRTSMVVVPDWTTTIR